MRLRQIIALAFVTLGVLQTPPLVARPPTQPAEEAAALEEPLAEAPIQTVVTAPEDLACAPPAVSVTVSGMPLSAEDVKGDNVPAKTADAPVNTEHVSVSAGAESTASACFVNFMQSRYMLGCAHLRPESQIHVHCLAGHLTLLSYGFISFTIEAVTGF